MTQVLERKINDHGQAELLDSSFFPHTYIIYIYSYCIVLIIQTYNVTAALPSAAPRGPKLSMSPGKARTP